MRTPRRALLCLFAAACSAAPAVADDANGVEPGGPPSVIADLVATQTHPAWRARAAARLALADPAALRRWAEELVATPDSPRRQELLTRLLCRWAEVDGAGAWDWALWQPSAAEATAALTASWAAAEGEAAVAAHLAAAEHEYVRYYGGAMLVAGRLEADEAEAMRLTETLTDPDLRAGAAHRVTYAMMTRPEVADGPATGQVRDWLETRRHDPAFADAFGRMTALWGERDPYAANRWAHDLPPGPTRDRATADGIASWAGTDPEAALDWLYEQDRGPGLDAALAATADLFEVVAPELSMAVAAEITDDDLRRAVTNDPVLLQALRQRPTP